MLAAVLAGVMLALAGLVGGCGGSGGRADVVRVGLFLNITHGPALISLQREFAEGLAGLPVEEQLFASGPEEVSALLSGSLDAGYMGPAPYLLAESRAPGRLRLLGGAVTGGQSMVARPGSGIRDVADLAGRRVAVPAHGNTQDLTLRLLLDRAGLRADDQGGDVEVVPVKNSALPEAVRQGVVDAVLAPAPFGERLVADGDAVAVPSVDRVLDRWRIPATVLVVNEEFARTNPDATRALVRASARAVVRARANPEAVSTAFNRMLSEATGKTIDPAVLRESLERSKATTALAPGSMALVAEAARLSGYLGGPVAPRALVPRAG